MSKKRALVESLSPQWKDLAQEWYVEWCRNALGPSAPLSEESESDTFNVGMSDEVTVGVTLGQ